MNQEAWLQWAARECTTGNIIRLYTRRVDGGRLRSEALIMCALSRDSVERVGVVFAPFAGWRDDSEQKPIRYEVFESPIGVAAGAPSLIGSKGLNEDWLTSERVLCLLDSERFSVISEFSFVALQQFPWLLGMIQQRLAAMRLSGPSETLLRTVAYRLEGLITEGNRMYYPLLHGM